MAMTFGIWSRRDGVVLVRVILGEHGPHEFCSLLIPQVFDVLDHLEVSLEESSAAGALAIDVDEAAVEDRARLHDP